MIQNPSHIVQLVHVCPPANLRGLKIPAPHVAPEIADKGIRIYSRDTLGLLRR